MKNNELAAKIKALEAKKHYLEHLRCVFRHTAIFELKSVYINIIFCSIPLNELHKTEHHEIRSLLTENLKYIKRAALNPDPDPLAVLYYFITVLLYKFSHKQ